MNFFCRSQVSYYICKENLLLVYHNVRKRIGTKSPPPQTVNFNLGNSNFFLGNTNFNLGNTNFIIDNSNFNIVNTIFNIGFLFV